MPPTNAPAAAHISSARCFPIEFGIRLLEKQSGTAFINDVQAGDYEIAAFVALVAIFELCERIWPARKVDRWRDLRLDVLSFVFAVVVNRLCTYVIRRWVGDVTPPFLEGSIRYLQSLPSPIKIVLALFLADFAIYWIHRAQHKYELLWRTHAWHHSIEQMYWFAGFRTSFLHSFIYNLPQVVIPITLFRLSPVEAGIGYSLGTHEPERECRATCLADHHPGIPSHSPLGDYPPGEKPGHYFFAVGPVVWHVRGSRLGARLIPTWLRGADCRQKNSADVFGGVVRRSLARIIDDGGREVQEDGNRSEAGELLLDSPAVEQGVLELDVQSSLPHGAANGIEQGRGALTAKISQRNT